MRFDSVTKAGNQVLLLVVALITPAVIGFQYLEWRDSNHLFIGIMGPMWTISYSDWYLNDWLVILIPNIVMLIPRLLFALALVGFSRDRTNLKFVRVFGLLLIGIEIFICLLMMISNSIFGMRPGVLISIAAPDVDLRRFVPTPIMLLVGAYKVWRTSYGKMKKDGTIANQMGTENH